MIGSAPDPPLLLQNFSSILGGAIDDVQYILEAVVICKRYHALSIAMELRHLRYFVAVAEELNFSRAAERLHIAQPPLSQQIRSLEEELGVQLFERNKHQVRLTPAGQMFLESARQTLTCAEQAIQTAQRASRGEIGRLVIGFASAIAYSVFPEILRQFREQFPNVELVLNELNTTLQIEALHAGAIDLGFVHLPIREDGLNLLTVFEESILLALPETHPLAIQSKVSLKSLKHEQFISFPRHLAPGFYDQIISACQKAGLSPNVIQEAKLTQTIVCLVAGRMGIALVPASLQNLQRSGVVYRKPQEKIPPVKTAMIWRQNERSAALAEFVHVARSCVARLIH